MIFVVLLTSLFLLGIEQIYASSSPLIPLTNYNYSISIQENISELWWNVNEVEEEILFELHVRTTGWIALGISPGKMSIIKEMIHDRRFSCQEVE